MPKKPESPMMTTEQMVTFLWNRIEEKQGRELTKEEIIPLFAKLMDAISSGELKPIRPEDN